MSITSLIISIYNEKYNVFERHGASQVLQCLDIVKFITYLSSNIEKQLTIRYTEL